MLQHIIDFLVDYFTNISAKKIVGGAIVIVGLWIMSNLAAGQGGSGTVFIAAAGILVSSIGVILIYYDIAKDKASSEYNELPTLFDSDTQKQKELTKVSSWNINDDPVNKNKSENK